MNPLLALRPLVIAAILSLGAALVHADSVVNSTGDGGLVYGGQYGCESDFLRSGVCTLRAAIEYANLNPDVDTITFNIPTTDPGYDGKKFTIQVNRNSSNPLPDLSTDMNISGPGAAKLTVWANGAGRQLPHIFNVTTAGTVSFSDLTIGQVDSFGEPSPGGIQNSNTGTVNVTNCVISGNIFEDSYTNSKGGGIYNSSSGTANVNNSTVSANSVSDEVFPFTFGGGIFNESGTVSLTNSRIINNFAQGGSGGGIYNSSGTLSVTNCELSGNFPGAIVNLGLLNLTNSTLSGNGSNGSGGAVYNLGTSKISNCTVTGNAAYGSTSRGGGISAVGGTVNVKSSIIAANTTSGLGPDVFGSFTSKGFNLIGKKDGSTGFTAATDRKGTIKSPLDPKLDGKGLRFNGGPTQTMALQTGSPAIDKGTSVTIAGTTLTTDQRGTGFPRTVDKSGIANATGGDGTDIGAFEVQ